ncbi:MAG TPA: hypothetical protein VE077_11775 [Candidatus Methylomirabilis sp.]|nr:hypothetical protein [Candidatus Methylomirabilis sp.]
MSRRILLFIFCTFLSVAILRASPPRMGAVVQTTQFDPAKSQLTVNVFNTSQKDITALSFTVFITHSDGAEVSFSWSTDFVWGIISAAEQGHEVESGASHGLGAGTSRDLNIPLSPPGVSYRVVVSVVIYADGTADVVDKGAFKWLVMQRKGEVLAMQKANELLAAALADPNDAHPSVTAEAQLKTLAHALEADHHKNMDDPASYEALGFLEAAQDIRNTPKDPAGRSAREDDHLRTLIKVHDNRTSLLLPHTEVVEGVRP